MRLCSRPKSSDASSRSAAQPGAVGVREGGLCAVVAATSVASFSRQTDQASTADPQPIRARMDLGTVDFGLDAVVFTGYPYPGSRVHRGGAIPWAEVVEVNPEAAPPE